jgi:hypothetical protein
MRPPIQDAAPVLGAVTENLVHDDGVTTISITFGAPPTAEFYEYIKDYAQFKADRLRKSEASKRRAMEAPNEQDSAERTDAKTE